MKKAIETYFCDDCRRQLQYKEEIYTIFVECLKKKIDLCAPCLRERLSHSFTIIKDRVCTKCDGKGTVKDYYGYHNDYDVSTCTKCHGKGILSIIEVYNDKNI